MLGSYNESEILINVVYFHDLLEGHFVLVENLVLKAVLGWGWWVWLSLFLYEIRADLKDELTVISVF